MARKKKSRGGRIKYRGKLYSRAKLARKIGKRKARKLWCKRKRRSAKKCFVRKGKRRSGRRSWKQLVKKYGVMGAVKRRRAGRRRK